MTPDLPAVVEADVLEADLAPRHGQRGSTGPVADRTGSGDRLDAVLDGADVLEQAGRPPTGSSPTSARIRMTRAIATAIAPSVDRRLMPGIDRDRRRRRRAAARCVVCRQTVELGDQPHLAIDGLHELVHRVAGVVLLAQRMGEELDRSGCWCSCRRPGRSSGRGRRPGPSRSGAGAARRRPGCRYSSRATGRAAPSARGRRGRPGPSRR